MRVADWNRKENLKATIRKALKDVLIKVTDGRVEYKEIDQLSKEIINCAEVIYAVA